MKNKYHLPLIKKHIKNKSSENTANFRWILFSAEVCKLEVCSFFILKRDKTSLEKLVKILNKTNLLYVTITMGRRLKRVSFSL